MTTAFADSPAATRQGIVLLLAGVFCISVNDTLIKVLSGGYPLHEIVLIRSSIGIVIVTCVLLATGGLAQLRTGAPGFQALRALCLVLANVLFFMGLAVLPLAEATAIFFVAPLLITLMSALLLGEPVGPRRIGAVIVGFAGVLVITGPQMKGASGAGYAALLPIAAAFCYASMNILTRRLRGASGPWAMAFYIQLAFILTSVCVGLVAGDGKYLEHVAGLPSLEFVLRAWAWPGTGDLGLLLTIGTMAGFVSFSLSQAYRHASAATVAPFEYAAMPFAVIWGFLVFGDVPDWTTWSGLVLIAGAGVYVFARESRKGQVEGRPGRRA
jgi:S-adenosylmethionine uptake transporter